MKKIFVLLSLCTSLCAMAQNDSVSLGAGATDMIFYDVNTGTKTPASNMDWHIAFSVRPANFPSQTNQSAAIRINEANGLKLYRSPSQKLNVWSTFDTTGYRSWQRMHNPDTTWTIGAFNINKNFNDAFNYGWCEYSGAPLHELTGDSSIYLLVLPDGSFRKLALVNLIYDTAYNFQFDKLDNSDFSTQEIRKKPYRTKSFVYYDLNAKTIRDKEPGLSAWDMVFLRYNNTTYDSANLSQDMGILTNDANSTYAASGSAAQQSCNTNTLSNYINVIGKTWKDQTNSIIPGQAYFVSGNISGSYKLTMTQFGGSTTGVMGFNIERCTQTGISDVSTSSTLNVYPVPASDMVHISFSTESESNGSLRLMDLSGREVIAESVAVLNGENNYSLNTTSLPSGSYILSVSAGMSKVNRMVSVVK